MARYILLCSCTGDGLRGQLVAVIDDRRRLDGRILVAGGDGVRELVRNKPNWRDKHLEYRFACPGCGEKVRWAENTLVEHLDRYVAVRAELETVQLPAPGDQARSLQLLEKLPPDRRPGWATVALAMMTDPEVIEPRTGFAVITEHGARYVIPFKPLVRDNAERRKR